jgi:hypothetical protein
MRITPDNLDEILDEIYFDEDTDKLSFASVSGKLLVMQDGEVILEVYDAEV